MGLRHSPKIVTDGLIMALDAGNIRSYDANSTNYTWYNPDTTRVSTTNLQVSNNTGSSKFAFGSSGRSEWDPSNDDQIGIGQAVDTSSVIVGDHVFLDLSASSNGTLLVKVTSLNGTSGSQNTFGIQVVESTGNMASSVDLSGETVALTIYPGVPGANNGISSTLPGVIKGATHSNVNGGVFSFDGSDDEIFVGDTGHTGLASLFAFINQEGTQGSYDGIIYSRGSGNNIAGLSANGAGGNLNYTWYNQSNTYNTDTGLSIPNNTYCMIGMAVDSSKADIYVNLSKFTNSVSHSASMNMNDLKIGRDEYGSRYFTGKIACVLMYNRYVTEVEVKQIYNALKGRFGL